MIKRSALNFIVAIVVLLAGVPAAKADTDSLIAQAKSEKPKHYDYTIQNGAQILPSADHKSFSVFWKPENYTSETTPVLVTIHGHGSWAFTEFTIWHEYAKKRGMVFLGIQWWMGQGEKFQDYLIPQEIYRIVDDTFREKNMKGPALFHGFSRGSANSYAVAAMDVRTGHRYFDLFIANSGKPGLDFPPNKDITDGRFGEQPLAGTQWITFAGGKDTHPERDGFEGMRKAKEFIEKYGGTVVLAIEDPDSDHGGFHRNPKNCNLALDTFEKIIKRSSS